MTVSNLEEINMTVLVDMDDVIEQLVVGWVAYINEKHGTTTKVEDVTEWAIEKAFPTLNREIVYAAPLDDKLWDYVGPMPDAAKYLQQLIEDGHEVFIVTATGYETLRAKMEKVLFKYFPFIPWSHVIITEHKELIKGDVLIDDGPHNLAKGDYKRILFDAGHNRKFDEKTIGAVRVHGWAEAYAEVCKLCK